VTRCQEQLVGAAGLQGFRLDESAVRPQCLHGDLRMPVDHALAGERPSRDRGVGRMDRSWFVAHREASTQEADGRHGYCGREYAASKGPSEMSHVAPVLPGSFLPIELHHQLGRACQGTGSTRFISSGRAGHKQLSTRWRGSQMLREERERDRLLLDPERRGVAALGEVHGGAFRQRLREYLDSGVERVVEA